MRDLEKKLNYSFRDPALLEEAKTEFQRRTAAGYTCPIPADAVPTIAD